MDAVVKASGDVESDHLLLMEQVLSWHKREAARRKELWAAGKL